MKIEGTELEYTETEGIALDYFLGGLGETKEQYAQRITEMCSEYTATEGCGNDKQGMPACFSRSAECLWREKQANVMARLLREFGYKYTEDEILKLKEDPEYRTATEYQKHLDDQEIKKQQEHKSKIKENIAKLQKKGFDDETIQIIYPISKEVM